MSPRSAPTLPRPPGRFRDPLRPPLGACAGLPVATFYPDNRGRQEVNYSEALSICSGCWVRPECLAYIDRMERSRYDVHGVAAGLTPEQRLERMAAR